MAPSKTFNIAGLDCSFAVVESPELRACLKRARGDLVGGVNLLGAAAAEAAYRDGQPWLDELLRYLEDNRDLVVRTVNERLPGMCTVPPEGTYLAWLDCRAAGIGEQPSRFFLKEARVALNNGESFGRGGQGFVRLNFGCPRALLIEGLERMRAALAGRPAPSE